MIIGTIVQHNASLPLGFIKSIMGVKEYRFITEEGPYLPTNRNALFEKARLFGESLLFIDADIVFTPQQVKQIEEHLKTRDVVSGVYVLSFPGWPPAIFDKNLKIVDKLEDETFEIGACGAGFLGISAEVVKTLTEPFTPIKNEKWGQEYGEDVSFCMRARDNGFKVWCDPSLKVGHIRTEVKYMV